MNLFFLAEIGLLADSGIAILPVLIFLAGLLLFDSFKLVSYKPLLTAIISGAVAALAAMYLNPLLIDVTELSSRSFSRWVAPFSEEFLKFLFIIYLIRASRVGFLVDAAIFGFAIGTGFAIIENIYYMSVLTDASLTTLIVRGFGTAVMHGGTAAVGAIICKDLFDRKEWPLAATSTAGIIAAALLHLVYNQFILPPLTVTLLILLTMPMIVYVIFKTSEHQTRQWLDRGLDHETELLRTIRAGNISDTPVGKYLKSIQSKFPDMLMADIIGYLRVNLELSIKAKGWLMMNESGVHLPPDEETKAQFNELTFLEKSIGTTGKLALQPLLKMKSRELWQLYKLQEEYGL